MRSDKEIALKLRLQGRSYSEIQQILHVPKSTLSSWLSGLVLSQEAVGRLTRRVRLYSLRGLLARNRNQTKLAMQRALEARTAAGREIDKLADDQLLILGAALYWAEGYKRPKVQNGRELTNHALSLTNSDPYLIRAFLRFLRECCKVPEAKIKASLRLFPHHNEEEAKRFWQTQTGIPYENFWKTYWGISKSSMGKRPFYRLPHGVIQIVVADTALFHSVIGYIEKLKTFV